MPFFPTMDSKEFVERVKKFWGSFCIIFFSKKNLKRDLIIFTISCFVFGSILVFGLKSNKKNAETKMVSSPVSLDTDISQLFEDQAVEMQKKEVSEIQYKIDTTAWTPYQNLWYGFVLKYSDNWSDPVAQEAPAGALWEKKFNFKLKETEDRNPFEGFDVVIYNIAEVKEISHTEEFPKLKNTELKAEAGCATIEGHLLETGDYPAEEIYLPVSDVCYNAALFFSNVRGNYIYNISPKIKEGMGLPGDPTEAVAAYMPEFFSMVSTWDLIDIQRPNPVPAEPRIIAPKPLAATIIDGLGRMICAIKNDHPHKSRKNKSRHMDMECCLDPDEYPNPWCYYQSK
jgi:hypothetical protein